jgi:glycosyltransferase involved in cell wall biosynthesis
MSYPLASIIIPTYNYAHYIHEAIDSILESDFPQDQIEILIIDDGSTDQTQEVVNRYGKNVKYVYQENSGKAWATKVGIDLSQGKYIFNLDADDWFLPYKVREVVQIFESDPEVAHVAHPALLWNANKDSKSIEPIPKHLLGSKLAGRELLSYFYQRRILFGGGSTFAARADALKSLYIPKAVDMYIDEYLVLCTLNQGYSFFFQEPLSVWRIHGRNFSDAKTNSSLYRAKMERSLSSMAAILESITDGDFDPNLQKIYSLNLKTMTLAVKENLGEKTLTDVVGLWVLLLQNFNLLNLASLRLIKTYTLLNRSLPTPIIRLMQGTKRKFA